MKALEQLNMVYDSMKKLEIVEKVMLTVDMDNEVQDLIKIKQALNSKLIELNNKVYEENKKAR